MEFDVGNIEDAIFHYMSKKPNTLVDINKVFIEVHEYCPTLNKDVDIFRSGLIKAINNFDQLKLFDTPTLITSNDILCNSTNFVTSRKYLMFVNNPDDSVTIDYELYNLVKIKDISPDQKIEDTSDKIIANMELLNIKIDTLKNQVTKENTWNNYKIMIFISFIFYVFGFITKMLV